MRGRSSRLGARTGISPRAGTSCAALRRPATPPIPGSHARRRPGLKVAARREIARRHRCVRDPSGEREARLPGLAITGLRGPETRSLHPTTNRYISTLSMYEPSSACTTVRSPSSTTDFLSATRPSASSGAALRMTTLLPSLTRYSRWRTLLAGDHSHHCDSAAPPTTLR
jgi:hypothetical protein